MSIESAYYAATPARQRYSWPLILGCTAVLAAHLGALDAAARLQGAVASDSRAGVVAHPEVSTFAKAEATARHKLGEDRYNEHFRSGRGMRSVELKAEIDHVLVTAGQPAGSNHAGHEDIGLTPREREVLGLMMEGKSNREIADTLYITVRTAKAHVSNILTKLDVESRTAAVTYAFKHDLGNPTASSS